MKYFKIELDDFMNIVELAEDLLAAHNRMEGKDYSVYLEGSSDPEGNCSGAHLIIQEDG